MTRSTLAHQFRPNEARDLAMDLSLDAPSLGLAGGGAPPLDFGAVMFHLLLGAPAGSPRLPAGDGDAGRKRRRTGEQD